MCNVTPFIITKGLGWIKQNFCVWKPRFFTTLSLIDLLSYITKNYYYKKSERLWSWSGCDVDIETFFLFFYLPLTKPSCTLLSYLTPHSLMLMYKMCHLLKKCIELTLLAQIMLEIYVNSFIALCSFCLHWMHIVNSFPSIESISFKLQFWPCEIFISILPTLKLTL